MKRFVIACVLAAVLGGCQTFAPRAARPVGAAVPSAGVFDNHEQVWAAGENASPVAAPHLRVTILPTDKRDWTLWQLHLDGAQPGDAIWALREEVGANAGFVPHRALVAVPGTGKDFDPAQWAPLDACTLKVDKSGRSYSGDAASCTVLAPGVGAQMALLPLAIEQSGEWLHLRLMSDQARGADAREDLRRVQEFSGWAAINGAGAKATAENRDWHMDRRIRIENEGGRYRLHWRDGAVAGYSLGLERLTYRDGNVPVLKLSLIEDASGQVLAYAWANPEATRIGLNLGWVQIGLDRVTPAP